MTFLKLLPYVILIFILGCSGDETVKTSSSTNNSILNEKPVFNLTIHSIGTRYDVLLNGITVYADDNGGGQVNTTLPINHWMRSGENSLELVVFPDEEGAPINEGSTVDVELFVSNDGLEDNQYRLGAFNFSGVGHLNQSSLDGYKLETVHFKNNTDGEVVVSKVEVARDNVFDGSYEYRRTFMIPSNLPLWEFFNSDDVPDEPELSEDAYWALSAELRDKLKFIQNKLIAGDVDDVMPLFKERNSELDMAFYYPEGTMEAKLRDSFYVDIPQLDMLELEGRYVSYVNENNMKLASVYRNLKPAISGNYKDGPGSLKFPVMFRKQDGKWIITR